MSIKKDALPAPFSPRYAALHGGGRFNRGPTELSRIA